MKEFKRMKNRKDMQDYLDCFTEWQLNTIQDFDSEDYEFINYNEDKEEIVFKYRDVTDYRTNWYYVRVYFDGGYDWEEI